MLVDEVRIDGPVQELLVLQNIQKERNVSFDSTNPELSQGSIHFSTRRLQIFGLRYNFDQEGVVVGRNDSACESRSAV